MLISNHILRYGGIPEHQIETCFILPRWWYVASNSSCGLGAKYKLTIRPSTRDRDRDRHRPCLSRRSSETGSGCCPANVFHVRRKELVLKVDRSVCPSPPNPSLFSCSSNGSILSLHTLPIFHLVPSGSANTKSLSLSLPTRANSANTVSAQNPAFRGARLAA